VFRDYYDEDPNEVFHRERLALRDGEPITASGGKGGGGVTLEPVPTEGAR
jgi:hypothetical protein